jgi:acyl-CoA thioesterase I
VLALAALLTHKKSSTASLCCDHNEEHPKVYYMRIFSLVLMSICGIIDLSSASALEFHSPAAVDVSRPKNQTPRAFDMQLLRLSQTLQAKRTVRILVIGSSSTVGVGASSPSKTYVSRLEPDLERAITGVDFQVVGRGVSGEVAQGAADRMRREVENVKPDLVVWQVGTNDALGHVAIDRFRGCLKNTLSWLKERNIDVVLINPQYGQALAKDTYYEQIVATIADVAEESHVLLVDRYSSMRKLDGGSAHPADLSTDNLHMNDEGYRRLAEQLSDAIVGAVAQSGHTSAAER